MSETTTDKPNTTKSLTTDEKIDRLTSVVATLVDKSTSAPATSPEVPRGRSDRAALHSQAAKMILAGASNLHLMADLGIDLQTARELRAAASETGDKLGVRDGGAPPAKRADRTFCQCGALQSMHAAGQGHSTHTGCPKFVEATDEVTETAEA